MVKLANDFDVSGGEVSIGPDLPEWQKRLIEAIKQGKMKKFSSLYPDAVNQAITESERGQAGWAPGPILTDRGKVDRASKNYEDAENKRARDQQREVDQQRRQGFEDLYNQLLQMMGQQSGGPSFEELQSRAQTIADAQFNPQIELLYRQQAAAQDRAKRSQEGLGGLYEALANSYASDVPNVQQTYQNAINTQQGQQQQLQQNLQSDYQGRQDALNQLAQQYNQQQAADEGMQPILNDQTFIQNLQQQIGQQGQQALQQQQAANVNYTQQGQRLSQAEGSNRQADVMAQLEDYMRQSEGNIAGLNAERQGSMASALAQMQNQQDQMRMQNQQNQWSQMMDMLGARQSIDKMFQPQQAEQPSFQDIIAGQRLGLDQEKMMNDYILELAKASGLEGADLIAFIQSIKGGGTGGNIATIPFSGKKVLM